MRPGPAVLATLLFSLSATSANALLIDANVAGIFTDETFVTPVAGAMISDDGDFATVDLQAGQGILIAIDVANPEAERINGIFVSIVVQGDQLDLLGAAPRPSILSGGGLFHPTMLSNIGSGAVKGNTPNNPGAAGDVWIQALAYGAAGGAIGVGPDIGAVQLYFVVTGASGNDAVLFDLTLTAGDAIGGASSVTFSSAAINPVPEPGTAILIGVGLAALARLPVSRRNRI